ncbi:hypothetical protein V6Z11_D04G080700 [Gossypium hirsutum]
MFKPTPPFYFLHSFTSNLCFHKKQNMRSNVSQLVFEMSDCPWLPQATNIPTENFHCARSACLLVAAGNAFFNPNSNNPLLLSKSPISKLNHCLFFPSTNSTGISSDSDPSPISSICSILSSILKSMGFLICHTKCPTEPVPPLCSL